MLLKRLSGLVECVTFRCLGACLVLYAALFVIVLGAFVSRPYLAGLSSHFVPWSPQQGLRSSSHEAGPLIPGDGHPAKRFSENILSASGSDKAVGSQGLPERSGKDNSPRAAPKVPITPLPRTPEKKAPGQVDGTPQKLAHPKETNPQAAQNTAGVTRAATKPQPKAASPTSANKAGGGAAVKANGANITDFTAVHGNRFHLYAAHYNSVQQPAVVTIVAIVNQTAAIAVRTLVCVYYSADDDPGTNVSASLTILPDHHYLAYASAFIHCSLPDSVTLTPRTTVSVSVTSDKRGNRYEVVKRQDTRTVPVQLPGPRRYNFLICFSPFHRNFGASSQVVANLELAQALGAQHAVVYNSSITRQLDAVLRHYVSKGFLEVLGWRGVPEPVHYKAQTGAINDCLLRNRQRADFIVYMDTDEMIVPRVHDSWPGVLRALQAATTSPSDFVPRGKWVVEMTKDFENRVLKGASLPQPHPAVPQQQQAAAANSSTPVMMPHTNWTVSSRGNSSADSFEIGAVSFVSGVFLWDKVTNLTGEELQFAQRTHLSYLVKQRRTLELWPLRSKTIVNPRTVKVMGIHRVASFAADRYRTLLVNETVGLLQHYRWYSPSVPSVKDVSVLRFASELVRRVQGVFKELGI